MIKACLWPLQVLLFLIGMCYFMLATKQFMPADQPRAGTITGGYCYNHCYLL